MKKKAVFIVMSLLWILYVNTALANPSESLMLNTPEIPNTVEIEGKWVAVVPPDLPDDAKMGINQAKVNEVIDKDKSVIEEAFIPVPSAHFPVVTVLTPGVVEARKIDALSPLLNFFVIGDDKPSREWLKAHEEALKASNAIGYVISVKTKADFDKLAERFTVPLVPLPIDDFLKQLKILHYPFWCHDGKVSQS